MGEQSSSPAEMLPTGFAIEDAYKRDAYATPLLSAEEEVRLAKRIEAGVFAWELLQDNEDQQLRRKKLAVGNYDGDQDLLRQDLTEIMADGEAARDHLAAANLRLVMKSANIFMAKNPQLSHMKYLDLVQEGNLGLLRAVEKFDYTKGYKFSTYALRWINQSMSRGVLGTTTTGGERPIHLPVSITVPEKTIRNIERTFELTQGRRPTDEEIIEINKINNFEKKYHRTPTTEELEQQVSKLSVELIEKVRKEMAALAVASLDKETEEGSELGEFQASESDVGREVETNLLHDTLRQGLALLSRNERRVVERLYGLYDGKTYSVGEIAYALKEKPTFISRTKKRAEDKLRKFAVRAGLRELVEF